MVLRKEKRRKVDAETLSAGNHTHGFSVCTHPIGLGIQKSFHLYTVRVVVCYLTIQLEWWCSSLCVIFKVMIAVIRLGLLNGEILVGSF